jgi:hypothetical protein
MPYLSPSGEAANISRAPVEAGPILLQAGGMNRPYVIWALIGMVGYSLTTLFMKLAIREGRFNSYLVLAIALAALSVYLIAGDSTR